jgi:hypothetical protein
MRGAAIIGGALATGLGSVLLTYLVSKRAFETGHPTGDALSEGFAEFDAAAIGLVVGTALFSFAASPRRRAVRGTVVGVLAYGGVLVPAVVLSGPHDVSMSDVLVGAAAFAGPAFLLSVLGAAVGAFLGSIRDGWRMRPQAVETVGASTGSLTASIRRISAALAILGLLMVIGSRGASDRGASIAYAAGGLVVFTIGIVGLVETHRRNRHR